MPHMHMLVGRPAFMIPHHVIHASCLMLRQSFTVHYCFLMDTVVSPIQLLGTRAQQCKRLSRSLEFALLKLVPLTKGRADGDLDISTLEALHGLLRELVERQPELGELGGCALVCRYVEVRTSTDRMYAMSLTVMKLRLNQTAVFTIVRFRDAETGCCTHGGKTSITLMLVSLSWRLNEREKL